MQEKSNSVKEIQPLLTIAIPTYNRAAFLELGLKRIFEEIDSLDGVLCNLVKVFISNNASTDDTNNVIFKYSLFKNVKFDVVTNIENIGAERNVIQCYKFAETPYVWILGDDDVILHGALKWILELLHDRSPDLLFLEGYGFTNNYLDEPIRNSGMKGVLEYCEPLDFIKKTNVMLSFLTALIVRSGLNLSHYDNLVEGTNLPQLAWILPIVRDGNFFLILKNRAYAARTGNSGGYDPVLVFGSNLFNISNNIFEHQPRLARAIQNGAIVFWFPIFILNIRNGRQTDKYLFENPTEKFEAAFKDNWRYYFFLKPLIILPNCIANQYYKGVRLVRLLFRSSII